MKKLLLEIFKKIDNGEPLTDDEKREYILYSLTLDHNGKMDGMKSCSTSCLCNQFCEARKDIDGCVCAECYSDTQLNAQPNTAKKMERNAKFYSTYEINKNCVPLLNYRVFRFEAFGDIQNTLQVKNYYTIAKGNKKTHFALWSKNKGFVRRAGYKPKNVVNVYSEMMLNKSWTLEDLKSFRRKYPMFDKVFCVFTDDYIKEHDVKINCGSNHCLSCGLCYSKKTDVIINERKKGGKR